MTVGQFRKTELAFADVQESAHMGHPEFPGAWENFRNARVSR